MQTEVDRGQAPRSVEGVNRGRVENEKDHVHFDDNRELTNDGHWRGGDGRDVTRKEREWLEKHGWEIPEKKDPAAQVSK